MSILAKYTLKLCATQCVRYAWLVLCTYMHMRWNFQSWIISAIGAVKEKNVTSARTKKNATNIVQEREKEIVCVCVSAFISAYNCTIFFYLPYTYRRVVWHTRKHQSLPPNHASIECVPLFRFYFYSISYTNNVSILDFICCKSFGAVWHYLASPSKKQKWTMPSERQKTEREKYK